MDLCPQRRIGIVLLINQGCLLDHSISAPQVFNDVEAIVLGRTHPPFPTSILASISTGIGEEILTRMFVFGLWRLILNWLFKRCNGRTAAVWIASLIAALAFGAGQLGTVFILTGASSPAELAPAVLAEVFLLNGLIGLVVGERYVKDGLIAATGVHFWTDVVFHCHVGLVLKNHSLCKRRLLCCGESSLFALERDSLGRLVDHPETPADACTGVIGLDACIGLKAYLPERARRGMF